MFLHLSVILFRGEVCISACWDTTPPEQAPLRKQTPQKQTPQGRRPPQEADLPEADPPREQAPPETAADAADGTHPIGMHSCWN